MVLLQDAAVTALAIAGAAILARKIMRAMRPKTAASCEHCPSGAAAQARRGGASDRPAART